MLVIQRDAIDPDSIDSWAARLGVLSEWHTVRASLMAE
jgi:hypothetical protein